MAVVTEIYDMIGMLFLSLVLAVLAMTITPLFFIVLLAVVVFGARGYGRGRGRY